MGPCAKRGCFLNTNRCSFTSRRNLQPQQAGLPLWRCILSVLTSSSLISLPLAKGPFSLLPTRFHDFHAQLASGHHSGAALLNRIPCTEHHPAACTTIPAGCRTPSAAPLAPPGAGCTLPTCALQTPFPLSITSTACCTCSGSSWELTQHHLSRPSTLSYPQCSSPWSSTFSIVLPTESPHLRLQAPLHMKGWHGAAQSPEHRSLLFQPERYFLLPCRFYC